MSLAFLARPLSASPLPRLSSAVAVRRGFATQPPTTTPSSSSPPPSAPTTPTTTTKSDYNDIIPIPKKLPPRKLQDGYSGGFYLSLLGGLLVATPIITYFYWEHRKQHMKSKKEAILHDIHARVRAS